MMRSTMLPGRLLRKSPEFGGRSSSREKALASRPAGWQLAGTAAKAERMRPRPGTPRTLVRLVGAVWARRGGAELARGGLPPAQLLREVGLRRERLAAPDAHIPFAAHVALVE